MHADQIALRPLSRQRPDQRLLFSLAVGAAVAGLASQAEPARAGPPSGEGGAGSICRSELGVAPGEAHYEACVQSLSQSSRDLARARSLAEARAGCLDQGLQRDTPRLARCVLDSVRTEPEPRPRDIRADANPPLKRSYFYASPSEAHRREERACASLGYDPATSGFISCVASLQSSMFMADNPLN